MSQLPAERSENRTGPAWSQELGSTPAQQQTPHPLSTCLNPARLLHTPVQVSPWSSPCLRAASQDPGHRPALPAHPGPQPSSQGPTFSSRSKRRSRRGLQVPSPALLGEQGYSRDLGHPSAVGGERGIVCNQSRVRSVPLNSGTRGRLGRGRPGPLTPARSHPTFPASGCRRTENRDSYCCRP